MKQSGNNNCSKKKSKEAGIVLRKMRELKNLSRVEAGIKFNLSHKTMEKLENGRGIIDEQRLVGFANGYGFTLDELILIKKGQFDYDLIQKKKLKKEKDPNRKDRRFLRPNVTKECKALRQLREKTHFSQDKLSAECGFGRPRIGFYENGRRNLTPEIIELIVTKMGFTMDDFNKQLEADEMPFEVIRECNKMMKKLDLKTLMAVRSFLLGFAN